MIDAPDVVRQASGAVAADGHDPGREWLASGLEPSQALPQRFRDGAGHGLARQLGEGQSSEPWSWAVVSARTALPSAGS